MGRVWNAACAALIAANGLISPASAFEPDTLTWSHVNPTTGVVDWLYRAEPVQMLTGGYVSAMRIKINDTTTQTWYYSNELLQDYGVPFVCPGVSCPGLIRYVGSWRSVGAPRVVAPNSIINDVFDATGALAPNRFITRPSVRRAAAGEWWAMVYVANGYPPSDGNVVPALMRSSDGVNWTYLGRLKGEVGAYLAPPRRSWGSSMAYEVKKGVIPLNHASPKANKHVAVMDAMGPGLALIYSADGISWYFAKNADGTTKEVLPPDLLTLNKGKIFASMRYIPAVRGYLMATTDGWNSALNPPYRNHYIMYSCNLLDWRLIGDPAKIGKSYRPGKNFSLTHVSGRMVYGLAGDDIILWPYDPKRLVKVTVPESFLCP